MRQDLQQKFGGSLCFLRHCDSGELREEKEGFNPPNISSSVLVTVLPSRNTTSDLHSRLGHRCPTPLPTIPHLAMNAFARSGCSEHVPLDK